MKILHVISTLQMGGAEHLMVDLLPALRDLGNEVELLLINGSRTPFYEELERRGIKIHKIQDQGRIYSPFHIFKAKKYMNPFDVIHTHTSPCQYLMAAAKKLSRSKVPLVTTEHSTTNHRRDKAWLKGVDRWMYRQYDFVICIAALAKSNLAEHLGNEKNLVVINNGVNIKKFINPIKSGLSGIITIIMVASMRDAKDQDTVIKALGLLNKNCRLVLVGDGPRRRYLENLATQEGVAERVSFLGNRDDIHLLLRESDIVVLSSHWEGLSLSSIEGMASGRPFIASDVQGLADMVRGYGILFPHGDDQILAKEIKHLAEDRKYYNQIAERCFERALIFCMMNR